MRSKLPIFLLSFALSLVVKPLLHRQTMFPVPMSPVALSSSKPGKKAMCAVYYEDDQWHLRMTSLGRVVFTGSVRVEGANLVGIIWHLEKSKKRRNADYITIHKDGRGFDFRFVDVR